jgi:hypothetical protein
VVPSSHRGVRMGRVDATFGCFLTSASSCPVDDCVIIEQPLTVSTAVSTVCAPSSRRWRLVVISHELRYPVGGKVENTL